MPRQLVLARLLSAASITEENQILISILLVEFDQLWKNHIEIENTSLAWHINLITIISNSMERLTHYAFELFTGVPMWNI